jgi:hypothetical protein
MGGMNKTQNRNLGSVAQEQETKVHHPPTAPKNHPVSPRESHPLDLQGMIKIGLELITATVTLKLGMARVLGGGIPQFINPAPKPNPPQHQRNEIETKVDPHPGFAPVEK